MSSKKQVTVLCTHPDTVLQDYQRLFELSAAAGGLDLNTTTILKDNMSWHFAISGANPTPWQFVGTLA